MTNKKIRKSAEAAVDGEHVFFSDDSEQAKRKEESGSVSYTHLQIDDRLSVAENIKNTFLDPTSALFEEPENLLKQEVREPALYLSLIHI